ncbi:unnamed protein product, partial [Soboliphyme baturini]|uniref:Pleckstrin homology domain-containing family F member 2 n=1 Tax=Soboliphyme baturini TaxID=241478 RepID=A0A183IZN8_9BILA
FVLVNSEANSRRIADAERCFGASGQPLAIPGRALVGEGVLMKMCRKRAKSRQFYLFNDILVYGNIVIPKRKFNKQHIIPLDTVQLEDLPDDDAMHDLKDGWLIRTPTKSFAVYAANSNEKRQWMTHIDRCIKDLLSKSGKAPVTEHAAVWVPDSDAPVCMICRKTEFTVFQRRHHCRKCGAVVCGACSNKRFLLPHQSNKPLRVCVTCYENLTEGSKGTSLSNSSLHQGNEGKFPNNESSGEEDSDEEDDVSHVPHVPPDQVIASYYL